jgi:hypothetical protein
MTDNIRFGQKQTDGKPCVYPNESGDGFAEEIDDFGYPKSKPTFLDGSCLVMILIMYPFILLGFGVL